MPSHSVFRAVGLPSDATLSDFQELRRFLNDGEELNLFDESIVPSSLGDGTLTGIFKVRTPLPSFLATETSGFTPIFIFSLRGNDVKIDRNFYGLTQLYPTEPEKPVHFCVPFARNERYVGGLAKHASIRDKLSSGAHWQADGHRRLGLWGLAGVGKTQDVLDYIYKFKGQLSVFWIYARTAARFEQDYRKLATLLQLPGHDDMKTDIRLAVKAWFESPKSGDWILVLDDVLSFYPAKEFGFATGDDRRGHGLAHFVPHGSKGTVIVTTRDYSVADKLADTNTLSKSEMSPDEAMQLFVNRYPNVEGDETAAALLLEELQYLPLAIVQTAGYLRQNRLLGISGYLQQFKATETNRRTLLSKPFRDLRRESDSGPVGVETSILTTFAITFEQIQGQWPLAGSFLEIIACIDRQGIPSELFHQGVDADVNVTNEALSKLMDFALITETSRFGPSTARIGERFSFVINPIVHLSIKEFVSIGEKMQAAMKKTGEILQKVLPDGDYENWNGWKKYLPHVRAWMMNKPATSEDTAAIYYRMSWYLSSTGHYDEAEDMARTSADMRKSLLGTNHPSTLDSMANLASTYINQRRWKDAEELQVIVLGIRKRMLGQEHPNTLTSMSNLAMIYRGQERLREAETLQASVLEQLAQRLYDDHPDNLAGLNNLAIIYQSQGRFNEAESLQLRVEEECIQTHGNEHPRTLACMNNLALMQQNQERLSEAEKLQEYVLKALSRILGGTHPQTLEAMNNLAITYLGREKLAEAGDLFLRVRDTYVRTLGDDHPDTLAALNNLAITYQRGGSSSAAHTLQDQALEKHNQILGGSHPHTLTTMHNLAVIYHNQLKWAEAEGLLMRVVEQRTRILGKEHADTMAGMDSLKIMYQDQGRWSEAQTLHVRVARKLGGHTDGKMSTNLSNRPFDDNCGPINDTALEFELGPVEPLLEKTLKFLSEVGGSFGNQESPSGSSRCDAVMPSFKRFRLWTLSFNLNDLHLDQILDEIPQTREAVAGLVCSFLAIVVAEYCDLCNPDTIKEMKEALSRVVLDSTDLPWEDGETVGSDDEDRSTSDGSVSQEATDKFIVSELEYITSALFDLVPALELAVDLILTRRQKQLSVMYKGPLTIYINRIHQRYPEADPRIIERLAEGVLKCYEGIIKKESQEVQTASPAKRDAEPERGSLRDSGLATLTWPSNAQWIAPEATDTPIARKRRLSDIDDAAGTPLPHRKLRELQRVEQSSVASSATVFSSGNSVKTVPGLNHLKPPPIPVRYGEKSFECPICLRDQKISDKVSWEKHVFDDISPYMCLESTCVRGTVSYKSFRAWKSHYRTSHLRDMSPHERCPFVCERNKLFSTHDWYSHVSEHLREIRLMAIEPSLMLPSVSSEGIMSTRWIPQSNGCSLGALLSDFCQFL